MRQERRSKLRGRGGDDDRCNGRFGGEWKSIDARKRRDRRGDGSDQVE